MAGGEHWEVVGTFYIDKALPDYTVVLFISKTYWHESTASNQAYQIPSQLDREEALKNSKTDPDEVLERTACCVAFSDASPDVEAALLANRHNCCIAYSGSNREQKKKEERMVIMTILSIVCIVCSIVAVILAARSGKVNRAVNKAVDMAVEKATKLME